MVFHFSRASKYAIGFGLLGTLYIWMIGPENASLLTFIIVALPIGMVLHDLMTMV